MSPIRAVQALCLLLPFAALSCASPPPPAPPAPPAPPPEAPPALSLENVRVVPVDTATVGVSFDLAAENAEALEWSLSLGGSPAAGESVPAAELQSGAPLRLTRALKAAIPADALGSVPWELRASASRRKADGSPLASAAVSSGSFPAIRPPRFSILSIKIKKAELINTKFEVVLRVENPNPAPLALRSLRYELYGEGRLWVDGETEEPIPVAANGSVDRKLTLAMNFINMKRGLLDQVIRLEIVDYRFAGDAVIATELPEYPRFVLPYDLRGRTSVVE